MDYGPRNGRGRGMGRKKGGPGLGIGPGGPIYGRGPGDGPGICSPYGANGIEDLRKALLKMGLDKEYTLFLI